VERQTLARGGRFGFRLPRGPGRSENARPARSDGTRFPINPNQLDKSAAAAFQAHAAGRLGYAAWKATAAQIERLRGIEGFRGTHGGALHNVHCLVG
jgi:hypothetical protein